ncbi:Ldh family oxidoreductase [Phytopseudomonas seleniipraecipitans]|uniref:Malate/lactate/ureidoglycolate dehydrogenase, LDH2 family n=1 Tax=Phytopseudomonas seleniipraecipitans TaxID=640205 RepID=A0A1G7JZA0_9GAMM|nr:Ldh family oxidoreductase [Pseudomonas seleniipraecipitans]SDF30296.1 Malate/lactate/ureidoglycolate dehydrogenase, LDH2 family [Pseudomonas seleniipraecipitans]
MSRIAPQALERFIEQLFLDATVSPDVAAVVSRVLVEGDLLGHHTHGVKLAQGYLKDLRAGHAKGSASSLQIVRQSPAAVLYDADYLLGPYCVEQALAFTAQAARNFGIGVATIRRSHHIACLAAYLQRYTEQGLMPLVLTSDPAVASVAPHGGLDPVYTPNPLGIGIPTSDKPILIDVSMSTITNGLVNKTHQAGGKLEHAALLGQDGQPTRDTAAFFSSPPGSILPLGSLEFGHKGFALGTLVEALTAGLGGFGRKDNPTQWGAAVTVLTFDPVFFGGDEAFKAEMDHFVDACLNSRPRAPQHPVRMPGHAGIARRQKAFEHGLALPDDVLDALRAAASEAGCDYPF